MYVEMLFSVCLYAIFVLCPKHGFMHVFMYLCVYACIYVFMHVFMCLCIYVFMHVFMFKNYPRILFKVL
jgi:hypothetical protein